MGRLLVNISLEQAAERFTAQTLADLPFSGQPTFLDYSAAYLTQNAHLLEEVGHPLVRVEPHYVSFRDDAGEDHVLPCLSILAQGLRLNAVPTRGLAEGIFPRVDDENLLGEVRRALSRGRSLWVAESDLGWDLRCSLFGLFSHFSAEERAHMSRAEQIPRLEERPWDRASHERLESFLSVALESKAAVGIPLIHRDHAGLQQHYPEETHIAQVILEGSSVGMIMWIENGAEAFLVEWVGDATFRRDTVLPLAVFELLRLLKQRGVALLHAAAFEWFLPPIWDGVMRQDCLDPARQRRHARTWLGLEARGMVELPR